MRVPALCGVLLAALSGCGYETYDTAVPDAQAAIGQPEAGPSTAVAPSPPAPVVKAPTNIELSKQCPLGAGTSFAVIRGWLERGDYEALDGELQRIHDAYRQTPACEHYVVNTFDALESEDIE